MKIYVVSRSGNRVKGFTEYERASKHIKELLDAECQLMTADISLSSSTTTYLYPNTSVGTNLTITGLSSTLNSNGIYPGSVNTNNYYIEVLELESTIEGLEI